MLKKKPGIDNVRELSSKQKKSLVAMSMSAFLLAALAVTACNTTGRKLGQKYSTLNSVGNQLTTETAITSTRPLDTGDSFRLGYGYDRLSGLRRPSCLDPSVYKLVGRNDRSTKKQSRLISTKEDLARELNIQVNAEASATYNGVTASGSSKTDIMKKATFSNRSIMAVLSFEHRAQNIEIEAEAPLLLEANQSLLIDDNKAFRKKCGDAYTHSVTTGAAVYILAQVVSKSSEITDRVNTENSVKIALDNLMSASTSSTVTKETKKTLANFSISLKCVSLGVNASACAEPLLAVNAEDVNPIVEYMNKVSTSFAESVNSNPNMMVAIDEKFEDYSKPEALADFKKFDVFFDYSAKLNIVKQLLEHEVAINRICNIEMHRSCPDIRKATEEQIKACARQDLWPDCNPDQSDIAKLIMSASKVGPGVVVLYEKSWRKGKTITLDFNGYALNPEAFQPGQIYNLADYGFADDTATDFDSSLQPGWQLRVFEHQNGEGKCYMIEAPNTHDHLKWFNDKASSFRLERKGDYPASC